MIRTKRLELRKIEEDDRADLVRNINDETVYKWTLKVPFPYTDKDFEEFLQLSRKWEEDGSTINLIIHLRENDEAIGGIGIMGIDRENGYAEIGYWISGEQRGKGYVPEALNAVIEYAFEELELFRLEAVIFSKNISSRRVLEKTGFRFEGMVRGRYLKDGKRIDGRRYALLRTDTGPER